jgi:hypothetical protein
MTHNENTDLDMAMATMKKSVLEEGIIQAGTDVIKVAAPFLAAGVVGMAVTADIQAWNHFFEGVAIAGAGVSAVSVVGIGCIQAHKLLAR